ncbi:MAG: Uma2 family endonuclease [Candidatus Sulfopaludibacter sp.]|nr:Uma2 family endonuclease [Candidatus Sulfopaludibacter sp.]
MSTQPKHFVTPEEYLELERKAEYKSEYYKGEIFAMSGASLKHNSIAAQLYFLIARHLQGKKCRWYPSDMRLLVPNGLYTYPDLSATCEDPQLADAHVDTLTNPTLVAEILSPSTENYDRGNKAKFYREIPSLRELLLISQDRCDVDLYRRQEDGTWNLLNAAGLDASMELASIGCTLQLRELYEKVTQ